MLQIQELEVSTTVKSENPISSVGTQKDSERQRYLKGLNTGCFMEIPLPSWRGWTKEVLESATANGKHQKQSNQMMVCTVNNVNSSFLLQHWEHYQNTDNQGYNLSWKPKE